METTTFEINEMLKEGILQGVLWTSDTVQRTAVCLARMPRLENLTILDNNRFVAVEDDNHDEHDNNNNNNTTFRALLQVLAQHENLKRLSIAHGDLSSVLVDIAEVYTHTNHSKSSLEELELVAGNKIRPSEAAYLRKVVHIPSQTLSLSFHLNQKDYGPVLQALRQGVDDGLWKTTATRILFRNVSFPDHEFRLHRFLAMMCQAACIQGLALNPRRRRVAHDAESMRVGPGFLPALARLLALDGVLESLDITNLVVEQPMVDDALVAAFRHALASNTSLQRLSLPCTKGMARIWQQAVFPALATSNRTLQRLEFGHEPGVVASFLHHLPHMQGLTSVQAPWRTPDGPAWMAAVPQAASLCHLHLRMVPNLHDVVKPCQSSGHEKQQQDEQEDYCLTQTRQWVERHRLTRLAQDILVQQPPETAAVGPWVEHLAGFVQTTDDVGLDARYVLLRESLAALVSPTS